MRRRKQKRNLFWVKIVIGLSIFVFLLISVSLAAYLMAVYKPSDYAPVPIERDVQESAVDQAIALVADIHNNIYAEEEFTQVFESSLINKLLLHDDLRKLLEDEFSGSDISLENPQISLKNSQIVMYITMDYTGHRVVISIALLPYIDSSGDLVIELAGIKSGALGLPMATIKGYLMQLAVAIRNYTDSLEKSQGDSKEDLNNNIGYFIGQSLPELLTEQKISMSPVITKPDEKDVHVSLVKIKIKEQKAELSFKQKVKD